MSLEVVAVGPFIVSGSSNSEREFWENILSSRKVGGRLCEVRCPTKVKR